MLWVTRSHVHVDRIACPWLITRFVDSDAEFLFVPKSQVNQVAEETGAILTVKLMYELERRQARYGLVTLCIGGGQGIASIFERAHLQEAIIRSWDAFCSELGYEELFWRMLRGTQSRERS